MFYDIIIIGAGISGSMCAYKLSKYKLNIAVVEAGIDVASGSTRANSAIIHAGYDAKEGSLKALLNVKGCDMMEELAETLGVHYNKCGSLVIGFNQEDREHIELLKKRGEINGVKGLRILEKKELHKMEPNVSPLAICALFAPSAGIVCPYDLAFAVSENAATNGVEFFFNYKVSSVERCEDGTYKISNG
jgi:glycerol-3-phosphate dehydrogenase